MRAQLCTVRCTKPMHIPSVRGSCDSCQTKVPFPKKHLLFLDDLNKIQFLPLYFEPYLRAQNLRTYPWRIFWSGSCNLPKCAKFKLTIFGLISKNLPLPLGFPNFVPWVQTIITIIKIKKISISLLLFLDVDNTKLDLLSPLSAVWAIHWQDPCPSWHYHPCDPKTLA